MYIVRGHGVRLYMRSRRVGAIEERDRVANVVVREKPDGWGKMERI